MYSPKIRDDQIQSLYRLKEETGVPMTRLLQEAADQFLEWAATYGTETVRDYFRHISSGDGQAARELRPELSEYTGTETTRNPEQAHLLLRYQKTIDYLQEENRELRAQQEKLIEFSRDWLDFEQASDDIKWYAVRVLKTLRR